MALASVRLDGQRLLPLSSFSLLSFVETYALGPIAKTISNIPSVSLPKLQIVRLGATRLARVLPCPSAVPPSDPSPLSAALAPAKMSNASPASGEAVKRMRDGEASSPPRKAPRREQGMMVVPEQAPSAGSTARRDGPAANTRSRQPVAEVSAVAGDLQRIALTLGMYDMTDQ